MCIKGNTVNKEAILYAMDENGLSRLHETLRR